MPETHGLFLWLINTCMKIAEVTNHLKTYIATVRVNGAAHKTTIQAQSSNAARLLLLRLYGHGNVSGVSAGGAELAEAGAGSSVMDTGQQQVKALADQARRLAQQRRQLQARQGMAKAQERMRQVSKQTN